MIFYNFMNDDWNLELCLKMFYDFMVGIRYIFFFIIKILFIDWCSNIEVFLYNVLFIICVNKINKLYILFEFLKL